MTTKNQDFEIYAGEDKVLACSVVDGAGDPFNLTGCTIYWSAALHPSGGGKINKSTGGDITVTSSTDGEFEISLNADDTDDEDFIIDSDAGEIIMYHYCKVEPSGGEKSMVFEGKMTIRNNPLKNL